METTEIGLKVHRRRFLQTAAGLTAGYGLSSSAFGQLCPVKEGTVRDRLWVFCNPINADFAYVRKRSVISPTRVCYLPWNPEHAHDQSISRARAGGMV